MYDTIGSALARYGIPGSTSIGGNAANSSLSTSSFKSSLEALMGKQNGTDNVMDRLRERFPGLSVTSKSIAPGINNTDKAFKGEQGNQVAVEPEVLPALTGNQQLLEAIEKAIGSFMNGAGSVPPAMAGSYTQRTVTISITTIRFTTMQRSTDTDEMVAGGELSASLQDKIQELVDRTFAKDNAEGSDGDATKNGTGFGFSASGWSMQLYYSNASLQALNGQDGMGDISGSAWSFQASMASFSGSFSQMSGGLFPQGLLNGLGDMGQGPFTSLLSGMGVSLDSVSQVRDGFLANLRESRTLLAELMELGATRTGTATTIPGEATSEVVDAKTAPAAV